MALGCTFGFHKWKYTDNGLTRECIFCEKHQITEGEDPEKEYHSIDDKWVTTHYVDHYTKFDRIGDRDSITLDEYFELYPDRKSFWHRFHMKRVLGLAVINGDLIKKGNRYYNA